MNDIIIMVDKNAMAYKKCSFQKIGNEQQNLQNKLKFEFEDEIVEGQAWLEYEIDGVKKFTPMEQYDKGYQVDIKDSLLISDKVSVDLKITQNEEPEGVPVFITNIVTFDVEKTICAEEEEPDDYPSWFETANKIINEANNLDLDINKNDNVSTITINKKDGTQKSVDVYDGINGKNGTDGIDGKNGIDGKDATINGQNVIEINTDNNLILEQQKSILRIGLSSQLIPKNIIEGTENIFEDGLDMPLFELTGYGKSKQITTDGRNLLNISLQNQTSNGVTITINPDKSITLNGTSTAEFYPRLTGNFKLENQEYTLSSVVEMQDTRIKMVLRQSSQNVQIVQLYNGSETTFNNTYSDNVYAYMVVRANQTFENFTIYPMLEKGNVSNNYEPFTGGQASPNPDYYQEINNIKGNLALSIKNEDNNNIINFELSEEIFRSIGDIKDELIVNLMTGDFYKNEKIQEFIFNGTETWNKDNISSKGFYTNNNYKDDIDINAKLLSDYYVYSSVAWTDNYSIAINTDGAIIISDKRFSTVEEFKDWLSKNNVLVNYQLKNPTTKKLGTLSTEDLLKLKTFTGYNDIKVDTNLGLMNIRLEYGLDIKKYIDNKLKNAIQI